MKIKHNIRIVTMIFMLVGGGFATGVCHALSYLEKKDNDVLANIERILSQAPMNPAIFDGKNIAPNANPNEVRAHFDLVVQKFNSVASVERDLSPAGRKTAHGKEVLSRLDAYERYVRGLSAAIQVAAKTNQAAASAANAKAGTDKQTGIAACNSFNKQLTALGREQMNRMVQVRDGTLMSMQSVSEIREHRDTMQRVAKLCAQPEFNNINSSCAHITYGRQPEQGSYCEAAALGEPLLQKAVINFASDMAKREAASSNMSPEDFKQRDGWVKIEGPASWETLTSGGSLSKAIFTKLKPIFDEVGLKDPKNFDALQVVSNKSTALADVVKQAAPTWKMPGTPCDGSVCATAHKTLASWYPNAKFVKNNQEKANWIVVQDEITKLPIRRYRSGFALLEVPGDPFCQLRSWTVTEKNSGGGSYQTANDAEIGYVRWQACK